MVPTAPMRTATTSDRRVKFATGYATQALSKE